MHVNDYYLDLIKLKKEFLSETKPKVRVSNKLAEPEKQYPSPDVRRSKQKQMCGELNRNVAYSLLKCLSCTCNHEDQYKLFLKNTENDRHLRFNNITIKHRRFISPSDKFGSGNALLIKVYMCVLVN